MTQDLTKITTPFGLLDAETQKALKECGGPLENFGSDGWEDTFAPHWFGWMTYRQKPAPREYVGWMLINPDGSVFIISTQEAVARSWEKTGRSVVKLTGTLDE